MKILIVDDDLNIVEMIKNMIPWDDIGIDEVLTANQGKRALECIYEHHPEIVISDIEMPVMDGLQLAEKIAEDETLDPEMIFLTCHADFGYARKAIRYGVREYLLKPFFPEELVAILSKMVIRCKEKNTQLGVLSENETKKEGNHDYVLRGFLQDVLDRTIDSDTDTISRLAKKREVRFDVESESRIIAIGIHYDTAREDFKKSDLEFIFRNIITEILYGLDRKKDAFLIDYSYPSYHVLYAVVPEQEYQKSIYEDKFKRLGEVMKQFLELYPVCVVSEAVLPALFADKKEQMDLLLSNIISVSSKVVFLEEMKDKKVLNEGKINQQEIVRCLQNRKKNELFLYMRHFLEDKGSALTAKEMKLIHHDLMQVFYGYLYENKISTRDLLEDETGRKMHEAAEYSSINMIKYTGYMYDYVIRQIDEAKEADTVIERAKKYIETHCTENIGRTEIAEEVMLAPNYLSMLFHKETGQTIREYINLCRLQEAKKIMESTNNSITEIALQIGFDNITYFSTIFKKYVGKSPVEYRKELKKND